MPAAQTFHIPAGLPIDESTRNELLDAGAANRANVNVRQTNRSALTKRLGFASLTRSRLNAVTRSNGHKLFSHRGIPCVINRPASNNQMFVDSYAEASGINIPQSSISECTYRVIDQPVTEQGLEACDIACVGNYVVTATGPMVRVILSEVDTGNVVSIFNLSSDGWASLATFSDRYIVAFVRDASTTAIVAYILDTQSVASGWVSLATVAASSASGVAALEIPPSCSLTDRVAVAYGTTSGTDRVTVKTYNASGLLETRTIGTSSTTPSAIDINGSIAGTLWVAALLSTTAQVTGIDADSMATTLATTATFGGGVFTGEREIYVVEGTSAGTARVIQFDPGTTNTLPYTTITTSGGAAIAGTTREVYSAGLLCRPWTYNGRFYAVGFAGGEDATFGLNEMSKTNVQRNCIVVDWTDLSRDWRPLANIEPGLVSVMRACKVSQNGSGGFVFPLQTMRSGSQTTASIVDGDSLAGLHYVDLRFDERAKWQAVDFANYTFLSGGLLSVFDGRTVTESNFLVRPQKPTTSLGATGITGTYRYVAIWEDVDAAGNWVVSGVSESTDSVSPANQYVDVSVPPLTVSSRINKGTVRVAFYRTTTGGEPPYYRLGTVTNDVTLSALTYQDTTADADLETRAKLYAPNLPGAAGEALDRRAPPGLHHITAYNGMLVGSAGENVFWSGQEVYGEAPWFSPIFQLPITEGGEITALAAIDGTLFVFKRDRIFAVVGEAPSDNGLAGGLGVPRLLASDVGCVDSNSVVVCSLGVFFRSERGFEILNRSQQVEQIGDPVNITVAAYPITSSAVVDDRNSLVRISLAEGESGGLVTGAGIDIVFDLTIRQWVSTDIKRGQSAAEASQSACVVQYDDAWRFAWLGADGYVYVERDEDDASAHLDVSSFVTMSFETAPMKLGLQSEQRVNEVEFLFERHSAAGLTIEVANDYGSYNDDTADKVWTEAAVLSAGRQVSFRPKPRGESVQLIVRDTEPAVLGNGKGLTFVGISADVAAEQRYARGTMRLAAGVRR